MKPVSVLEVPPGCLETRQARSFRFTVAVQDILELSKARVSLLILVTTLAGFVMAARHLGLPADPWTLVGTLVGTALVASSAAAFNQIFEREQDARMDRTRDRPLPAGRISRQTAFLFAAGLIAAGECVLATQVNWAAAGVAALTFASYVFLYTPLKSRTHVATVVGAVPGALPPLIGWVAAAGELTSPAWILFGILFFWQLPHFLALAWLYRDDYARGGFPLLTVVDPTGRAAARQVVTNSLALLTTSLVPTLTGLSGPAYFWGALVLGIGFLVFAAWFAASRSQLAARAAFVASIAYLPLLLVTMVIDSTAFR